MTRTSVPGAATAYPMSPEQESIWLNDQFQDGPSRYLESWAYRLRGGPVDHGAVRRALDALVARHESLRSALTVVDGMPWQTVLPSVPVGLDVRRVRPGELGPAMTAAATRPVDLARPPLLRASLLVTAADDAVLVVAIHHAVVDGWSFSVLDREFSALYRAALENARPSLPTLPVQLGPYLAERSRAEAADRAASLDHWRAVLAGAPAESAFPQDRARPATPGHRGDRVTFTLGAELGSAVRDLARTLLTTPFVVLATALAALLARLSDQDDVVLGTPVSRRDPDIADDLIACLADVLPLRLRLSADASFGSLVTHMKEQVWGMVRHRGVPFADLIRELAVERSPGRFPLFQVVFGLDDAPPPRLDLPGLGAERVYIHSGTAKYDVFLHLVPEGGGFRCFLEYATDLFDRATADRLAERLLLLLTQVTARPGTALRDLEVLTGEERRLILGSWAPGPATAPARTPVHATVVDRARLVPGEPAVRDGHHTLTYAEVERGARRVAAHLVRLGAAGRAVGVCLPRSVDLPVAVLGVLRAGSACLPLDPAYPADRLAHMVADSGLRTAVVARELAGLVPDHVGKVFLDDLPDAPGTVLPAASADDPAYLIYTSGSSGRPKGVTMPHRSLANLVAWQRARSAGRPRTLQFAALSFDVAFQEIFATWAAGGTLVMCDEPTRRDPRRLLDLIRRTGVERLFLPFVALQMLAEHAVATGGSVPGLREVVTAGEQLRCTPAVREFFRRCAPAARLDNQYGPSETHVVTAQRLEGDPSGWPDLPPIGRPVDNTRVLILDAAQRLSPIGTVGEICIGGVALADGYIGGPEPTAAKFIADPYRPGERLYRSGDLARYRPDGRIECLGRLDGQVKIRGHRVETGEVAVAIEDVPGVAHAAVVARPSPAGDLRLIAYYVPGTGDDVPPDAVRHAIARRLPEFMVPQVCVPMDALPRTASGKVDTAALPAVAGARSGDDFAEPRTDTEKRIAKIWGELLGVPRVGAHDDFFTLGGHSLLATRLVLRLGRELGADLPLSAFATATTVAGLAALLDGGAYTASGPAADLVADAQLPADIRAADVVERVVVDPAAVLLTGATGFLGAFLLRSLLDRTNAVVHCLVRGADRDQAAARLERLMNGYGLWDRRAQERVTVVLGDLAQPALGLSEPHFDELSRTVDAVYHAGAAVHLVLPYEQLKPATVGGTTEILRLAARHRSVPVHHVSTVGVFAADPGRPLGPDEPIGPPEALVHGYTQSKFVAEKLIETARERSLPVTVHRPSRIAGHSRTGACQRGDYLWLILKGCIQAQAAPTGVDTAFDLVPVDYVSDAVVELSQRPAAAGGTYHLVAGRTVRLDLMLDWLRSRGYPLSTVDAREWLDRIGADTGNAAFPLLTTLEAELIGAGSEGATTFDAGPAEAALAGSGVHRPAADEDRHLFHLSVDHFVRTGWLPPAQAEA